MKKPNGLRIDIPGRGVFDLRHLLLDANGTTTLGGEMIVGVRERLEALSQMSAIHVITADTFGTVTRWVGHLDCILIERGKGPEDEQKEQALVALGADQSVAIGNGANDALMLKQAAIGICVVGREGAAGDALLAADVIIPDIRDALDLLIHPRRLIATLRR
jgi:soluble P-type ATPase